MPYKDKVKQAACKKQWQDKNLKDWQLEHPEQMAEYRRRWRLKNHDHIIVYAKDYQKKRDQKKEKARQLARDHVPLKDKCEICSSTIDLERHHDDYSKPLDVKTVCHKCNMVLPSIS